MKKGIIKKTDNGWIVEYIQPITHVGMSKNFSDIKQITIHPDDEKYCENGKEIEFNIEQMLGNSLTGWGARNYDVAKLVIKKLMFWEILVPTTSNEGIPIRTRHHRVWDDKVREITRGLTITPPIKGQWMSNEGELFTERMIPVRICCNEEQIELIADMTAKYYKQRAIMYYLITDKVKIKHYP